VNVGLIKWEGRGRTGGKKTQGGEKWNAQARGRGTIRGTKGKVRGENALCKLWEKGGARVVRK